MKKIKTVNEEFFKKIEPENLEEIDKIIENVKKSGVAAVNYYSKKFGDGEFSKIKDLIVSDEEIEQSINSLKPELKFAIEAAINNIRGFANGQMQCIQNLNMKVENFPNSVVGHRVVPIENVLCYVPNGNYPLISSALMGVIPAVVAGVSNVMVTSPKITKEVIAASYMAGAHKIYKVGGAQAIAAFAYGVKPFIKADKIVGPGNKYVTYAKKKVYGECGIDFLAGPSEVLIVADSSANADFVACDILSQCEHDINARAYLITTNEKFADEVMANAVKRVEKMSDITKTAFKNSICVIVRNLDEAIKIVNKKAPEHLELVFKGAEEVSSKFTNYGSLFFGSYSAEVFGDYCTGTNHILPTNQVARYHGGLSIFDFLKIQTYQRIDMEYAKILSKTASVLAHAEGLFAHKAASDVRGNYEA